MKWSYSMSRVYLMMLFSLLLLNDTKAVVSNPWDSLIPKQSDIIVSEYPRSVKACNILFWNNIGNYSILSNQATNLTNISAQLVNVDCSIFKDIIFYIFLACVLVLLVFGIAIKADMTDWTHILEFMQEMFIITLMNVVRDPCLYQFLLTYKPAFFVWFSRVNTPIGTNFLKKLFFQSCYFLENVTELAAISSGLFLVYLIMVVVEVFMDRKKTPGAKKSFFDTLLGYFEFGIFIRLGQVIIMPYTFWTFSGLRVVAFNNVTRFVDFILAIIYCLILLAFSCFSVYTINYMPINLEADKTIKKYGAFYSHMRYLKESKLISNEFPMRQSLKMVMAGLHVFGYFFPTAVGWTGVIAYGLIMIIILISFWGGGMYKNKFQTFKMAVFHLIIMANYIFALAQTVRISNELFIASFLLQLINVLTIIYLIVHCLAFFVIHLIQMRKKTDEIAVEDGRTKANDLNVTWGNTGLC